MPCITHWGTLVVNLWPYFSRCFLKSLWTKNPFCKSLCKYVPKTSSPFLQAFTGLWVLNLAASSYPWLSEVMKNPWQGNAGRVLGSYWFLLNQGDELWPGISSFFPCCQEAYLVVIWLLLCSQYLCWHLSAFTGDSLRVENHILTAGTFLIYIPTDLILLNTKWTIPSSCTGWFCVATQWVEQGAITITACQSGTSSSYYLKTVHFFKKVLIYSVTYG